MNATLTEQEKQNFHRLVTLLVDYGGAVLRKLLMKYALMNSVDLKTHLGSNKHILLTLQTKNVLNQSQIDLLFPSNSAADVESFDITLLSCLLRNTCGRLTPQESKELNALRSHRNNVSGHSAQASINQNDYDTLWKEISTVVINLATCSGDMNFVNETKADIRKLETSLSFRPATDLLLQWYHNDRQLSDQVDERHAEIMTNLEETKETLSGIQDQNVELLKQVCQMKNEADSREEIPNIIVNKLQDLRREVLKISEPPSQDPVLEKMKKSSRGFMLAKAKETYVNTEMMREAEKHLQERGSVVISGRAGEGKTFSAVTLMTKLHKVDRCLVLSHPREWTHVDIDAVDVLFIDDMFGMYQLETGLLSKWMHVLDKLTAAVERKKVSTIISTRSHILNECLSAVSRYSIFNNIVEFSSDKLLESEKRCMLDLSLKLHSKTMAGHKVRECVRNFTSPIGFPFCCHLFCTDSSLLNLRENFFKNPLKFFQDNLETLEKADFASLVYLFRNEGHIPLVNLTDRKKRKKESEALKSISTTIPLDRTLTPVMVKERLEKMKGSYVLYANDGYGFVHNTISEAISLLYGKNNPEIVISTCSLDFLYQCTAIGDPSNVPRILIIPANCYKILSKRFISELVKKSAVSRTALHAAFQHQGFVDVFVKVLQRSKLKNLFFQTGEDSEHPFAHRFLEILSQFTCKDATDTIIKLLKCLGKCSHLVSYSRQRCWKCKLMDNFLQCTCLNGNKEVSILLLNGGVRPSHYTLDCALKKGDIDIINLMILKMKLTKTWRPEEMVWCLDLSCSLGYSDVCILFLDNDVKPTWQTMDKAVENGSACICRAVAERMQAQGTWEPNQVVRCLDISCQKGDLKISQLLIENGVLPSVYTVRCSVEGGNAEIVRMILNSGQYLHMEKLKKCLHDCVKNNKRKLSFLFLENGVAPLNETIAVARGNGWTDFIDAARERFT